MSHDVELPSIVEVIPNHVGEIGEALFHARHHPPEPISHLIREFCRNEAPDWIDVDEINLRPRKDKKMYVVETEDSVLKWERDSEIIASYRLSAFDDGEPNEKHHQVFEEYGTTKWEYSFPIELKTGFSAELAYDNQRKVMQYLAMKPNTQPILIGLGIDGLPETFTVEEIKFIE